MGEKIKIELWSVCEFCFKVGKSFGTIGCPQSLGMHLTLKLFCNGEGHDHIARQESVFRKGKKESLFGKLVFHRRCNLECPRIRENLILTNFTNLFNFILCMCMQL